MLAECGLASAEELIAHLPGDIRLKEPLKLAPGKSEYEIYEYFRQKARKNQVEGPCFLGAGAYRHYQPVVIPALVSRAEYFTSYTPYQAEISQGTLATIFEFQTLMCQLTGMEVANASMYDGSTAMAEAALMARRLTGRDQVVVARTVHPEYREVLRTYSRAQEVPVVETGYEPRNGAIDLEELRERVDEQTAAVILQHPNFFGVLEPVAEAARLAHERGALLVVVFTEAVAYGLLRPPVEADIVAGELQAFGIPPAYGGPFAGVIATKERFVRQLPGRLVGMTRDRHGNRAFCLTLATREQHIRREKATSNICTNQALTALMATIFLAVYGRVGLRELAEQNLAKAHYLASKLELRFEGKFFNEFVARAPGGDPEALARRLREHGIVGGLPLGRFYPELEDCWLLCATETCTRADMDRLVELVNQA